MKHILKFILASVLLLAVSASCQKDPVVSDNRPELMLMPTENLGKTSITLRAGVTFVDLSSVRSYGFILGSDSNLETNQMTVTVDQIRNGVYYADVVGLEPGRTYFYAAFVTNGVQTVRSEVRAFTTLVPAQN